MTPLGSQDIGERNDVNFIFEIQKMRTQSQFKNGGHFCNYKRKSCNGSIQKSWEISLTFNTIHYTSDSQMGVLVPQGVLEDTPGGT